MTNITPLVLQNFVFFYAKHEQLQMKYEYCCINYCKCNMAYTKLLV